VHRARARRPHAPGRRSPRAGPGHAQAHPGRLAPDIDPVDIPRRRGRGRLPRGGLTPVPPRVSILMPVHNRAYLLDLVLEKLAELMEVDEAVGVVTGKVVFDAGDIHACGVNVVGPAGWHERGTAPAEPIGHRMRISRVEPRPLEGQAGELETQVAEVDSG